MEQWQAENCAGKIKLVRYLLTEADNRGLTHGEKHYLMQTALFILHDVQGALSGKDRSIDRHEVTEIKAEDVNDIPF